ncbi:hypothetical protein [Knoellia locipacati]|nr:hypothetical protein [Knoellia locipacati]
MSKAFVKLRSRGLSQRVTAPAEDDHVVDLGAVVVMTAPGPMGPTVEAMFAGWPRSL